MDDDEVQVVEVTVCTSRTTPIPKKRKRQEESPLPKTATETPSNDVNILQKAAQLKRRLEFCEKEREELTRRFAEIKTQLTEQQCCELDVKLETSEKNSPIICVGDTDEDDDVVFILPEDYSPRKRRKMDNEKKAEKFDKTDSPSKKDVAIACTYYKPGTNLPHAREHCGGYKFVQSNVTTATVSCNESYCEKCYCYVCDALVKECDSWKTGTNPHCNAYAKNAFWEKLRKMAKRKVNSVQDSLLKSLPADEQSESLVAAATKASELLETLRDKLNNSSGGFNSRSSSPSCDCECHYDSCGSRYDEGEGCYACEDSHEDRYDCFYNPFWGRYDRFSFDLNDSISSPLSKAKEYLAENQPGPAALVLDALTVVLLPADNERIPSHQVTSAIKSLRKAWIEVLIHPDLPKNVEDKVRERLKNAISGALICSPDSTGLKEILEIKKWNDDLLVKCFAGKLGTDFIKEDDDVVEARLAFLEKNKRFSDALSYMLSCKVTQKNRSYPYLYGGNISLTSTDYQLTNLGSYRKKFVLLLAKAGKIYQALNVLTLPIATDIPKDIMTKVAFKDSRGNTPFSQCTLGHMDYSSTKDLLTAFVTNNSSAETNKIPSPSDISEEALKKVLAFVLTGAQVISSLRIEQAMEWYINTFCVTSLPNDCPKEKQQAVAKEAELLVTKAKQQFLSPSEIKPPKDVSFKVFVVQLFAALTANLYVNNNCYPYFPITTTLETFKRKNLIWACVSVVLSPVMSSKINSQILNFFLVNVMKPLGSRCIPFHVYKSWVNKLNDIAGIEKNYEIAHCILKEGTKHKSGPDSMALRKDAVLLVKSLTNAVDGLLGKAGNWGAKDRLKAVLNKIKKDFGKEVSKQGMNDFEGQLTSLCFKNDPSYANFEDVKKAYKGDKWPPLRLSMLDFLKKHRTSHTGCCIEVFGRCGMYNDVKLTLGAIGGRGSYTTICEKIKDTISKLKKDEACQFVDACADWLPQTLCDAGFAMWRYTYKNMPEPLLSCVRAIANIKRETFTRILTRAIELASQLFCRNTVQLRQRQDLERWLRDIKELFGKQELTAWSWAFHNLTTGALRRKPAVIKHLRNSSSLELGTIPHYQLLAAQRSAEANSVPSGKPTQGSATQTSGSGTQTSSAATAKSVASGKPTQGSATQTSGSGTQASSASTVMKTPVNVASVPSGKPTQASATQKTGSGTQACSATGSKTQASSAAAAMKTPVNVGTPSSNSCVTFAGRIINLPGSVATKTTTTGNNVQTQSVTPAVSTASAISTQKVVVNLPFVNITNLAASSANTPRSTTPTKTVYLTAKTTNPLAVPSSTAQAVPPASTPSTGSSLVTTAPQGASNPQRPNSAVTPKP